MASGICKNCGHAQALHGGWCTQMIPIDNRGNYRMCGCTNYQDSEEGLHQLLEEALNLINERYSEALKLLADC